MKYDFIQKLLNDKRLTAAQRDRVLALTQKEIEKDSSQFKIIEERLVNLENITNDKKDIEESRVNNIKNEDVFDVKYESPVSLYNFLLDYNKNPILKTTCHDFDIDMYNKIFGEEKYDFKKHLDLIKRNFEDLKKKWNYTGNMVSLISRYIYGKGEWSTQRITLSWSDPELLEWTKKNVYFVPSPGEDLIEEYENEGFNLQIPFTSNLTRKKIKTFTDFVLFFKSLWHIKKGNDLKSILEIRNEDYKFLEKADIKFSENFSKTIHLFTDVDKLLQAYSKLINLPLKINKEEGITEKPQFLLSFYEEENSIIFSIHHLNSIFGKSINSVKEKPFGQLIGPIIEKQINGLCDFYIRAEFENKNYAEINMWNGYPINPIELNEFNGVEYVLKFKK